MIQNRLKKLLLIPLLFGQIGCALTPKPRLSKNWKRDSLKLTRSFASSYGKIFPEYVSRNGFTSFRSKTTSYSKDLDNQEYAHAYSWKNRLTKFLQIEKNPELVSDARILLDFQNLEMEKIEVIRSVGVIPFVPLSDTIFNNISSYLQPDTSKVERNAAMARFRAYVRGETNKLPLVDGLTSHMLYRMKVLSDNRMRGFWPMRQEIEEYIKNSNQTLSELEKLLSSWQGDEWKRDLEELKSQDANYQDFLVRRVLPYSRKNPSSHPKVYALDLKFAGVLKSPDELIKLGLNDFKENYEVFKELARKVAQNHNLPDSNPKSVVRYLKNKMLRSGPEIFSEYNSASEKLMSIIKEKDLITIQEKPLYVLRFATQAEMTSTPSPQFIPAPMNTKQDRPAQFVIPTLSSKVGADDFSYQESIFSLVAHEAIPGHALQFKVMKDRGITLMRSWLAENSANTEGWGLYAESIVAPFLEDEYQFIFMQRKLWRIARIFLDPQINLGKITKETVKEVFVNDLGFSDSFATTEYKRYSILAPGQATSYYYGYKSLIETKDQVKEKLKENFNEKCFNDAVLDLGLLPLAEINSRLVKDLNCGGD